MRPYRAGRRGARPKESGRESRNPCDRCLRRYHPRRIFDASKLRVLLPTDPDNYYRQRDILPADLLARLGQAAIVIANYHAFLLHERGEAARLTKAILTRGEASPFVETADQMVRRVCRELAGRKQLVVINDEAHHCYRPKPSESDPKPTGGERAEAKKRDEEARVWMTGLEAVHRKLGLRGEYDLSATPFFLKGSGYPEGTLFPWVVSDFSLIDAIESGIVKVPRVPVEDNAMVGDQPRGDEHRRQEGEAPHLVDRRCGLLVHR